MFGGKRAHKISEVVQALTQLQQEAQLLFLTLLSEQLMQEQELLHQMPQYLF